MSRSDKPQRVGKVLEALYDQLGIRAKISEAEIIETWAALAGPRVNAVTDSAWLQGNKLFVKVNSAAWRQQLHLNRSTWKDRLNQELGKDLVTEILFR